MRFASKYILFAAIAALAACSDRSLEDGPQPPAPQPDAAIADVEIDTEAGDAPDVDKDLADMCHFGDMHAVVAFKAPQPRGEGHLAYSASVDYPDMANKPDLVPGLNPFPGCVAAFAADQELGCDFGAAFQGTVVKFNIGLNDGSFTEPASNYFSTSDGKDLKTLGTYAACIGTKLVGSCKDGKCERALTQDKVTGNLVYTFPQP
ncbi:MAG: hypothetical protein WC551_05780 [Patescibacteria group bacterium]